MARHASRIVLVALALGFTRQCRSQKDYAELYEWLRECGAENIDFLRIVEGIPKGKERIRGIVATENIRKPLRILIPEKCTINQQTVFEKTHSSPHLSPHLFRDDAGDLRDFPILTVYFAALKLAVDEGIEEGDSLFYGPYIRSLPTIDDFRSFHPSFIDEGLAEAFAVLPHVKFWTQVRKIVVGSMLSDLDNITSYSRENFGVEGINAEYLTWAATVVLSRAYNTTRGRTFVPLSDMGNTAFEDSNMDWAGFEKGSFELKVQRDIAAGEEITENYGKENNVGFHQGWGFLREGNPNPMPEFGKVDCLALKPAFALSQDASSQPILLENLKKLAIEFCRKFKRKRKATPHESVGEL